jgi:hypothetical protein
MVQEAVFPLKVVAVMVLVPAPIASISPLETVTTAGLLVVHGMVSRAPHQRQTQA